MLFCTSNLDIIIVKKKEKVIFMKHKHKFLNRSTFDAKVDIVISPDNIKYYSLEREDFTELAFVAIKNKPSTIRLIP